jgi:hypothetical protein
MSSFATSPVVLTATTSFDEEDAVMSRIRNVNATGFDHGLFEQARDHQEHAPESIDYIAWEPSSGVLDGLRFEVGRKSGFGHGFMNLVFESLFQRPPVFIPELQTTYGQTTDILRWKNLHAESVDIRVQGEADRQGSDPEDGSEDDLGYIAIDID